METRVKSEIRTYIVGTWLNGDERGFDDDTDLHSSGILDSFSMLALTGFLGDVFDVRLAPIDVTPESFRSVNALTRLVIGRIPSK